jgi:septal ring factor EnvC (AmiA/AmiB activator)
MTWWRKTSAWLLIPIAMLTLAVAMAQENDRNADLLRGKMAESEKELTAIRQEIQAQQDRMTSLNSQEEEVKRDHQEILAEIDLIQQLLSGMDQRQRLLEEQKEGLQVSLDRSRRAYRGGQEALAENLRAMYRRGRYGRVEMILTSPSFSSIVTRMRYEALLTRLGAGLVEQTKQEAINIHSRQKQLEVAQAEINLSREEAAAQTSRLEDLVAEQMAALRDLKGERQSISGRLLELSMNEQRLSYVLEDLEQQRQEKAARQVPVTGSLQDLAGQLEWPVQGELLRGFGRSVHPRFKTVTLNNGVNIAAAVGAPVAAVGLGVVEFADVLPGFGQCVILDHDNGYYTLYAHLDRTFVTKGQDIAQGQVIAEVGRPEPGEPSQLYFEVRLGKTPLDPADWLRTR